MKFRLIYVPMLLGCLLAGAALAKPAIVSIDELHANEQQRQAALIITQVMEKFHYRKPRIDDDMSVAVYERYLESLDANRSFFSAKDIEGFERYRDELDDSLRTGKLDPAFRIFRRFRELVEQRVAYAKELLQANNFDFTTDETYQFDRSEADWLPDAAALDDLWRRRVKNDILSLRLAGKDETEIAETLRKRYEGISRRVVQMAPEDVFQAFINAFTLSVEPHTSYMSPRLSENFDIGMRLSLQGIGAVLRNENEFTQIQSTVPGGPAERSGELKGGDRIVGVAQGADGEMEDVIGWRLQDVVDLIRGPKDSVVRLNILPKSQGVDGRTREVLLVRDEIKLEDKAAKSEIIEATDGVRLGVIEVPAFYRDFGAQAAGEEDFRSTTRDVRVLLDELQSQEVDGIIIDLRRNGGGSLSEATELTGLFIEKGPVVQVKDSSGRIEVERDPDPEQVYAGPLAVLVDRNSASASEIFAGAIQDYNRGLILGEPTFGKGTVQTLVDLGRFLRSREDIGRLRLTMAQFFRVQGGSTQHRGVMPDIVYPTAKGAADHGERALDNALPWASIKAAEHQFLGATPLTGLRDASQARIAGNPGFRFLLEEEDDLIELDKKTTVSLNESVRRAEWDRREQERLDRRNRLRAFRNLPPLASLDEDEDEDVSAEDDKDPEGIQRIMLEESANILADHIISMRPRTALAH
ncbi:MAG: carboxy terminal-processing peptidase [Gammaproteobacteria bacterium]|jgi:carboxyl-terminal processing protease|nr:carboxy terminal-processing peptidase [Gammaproteobacteria bacterium]